SIGGLTDNIAVAYLYDGNTDSLIENAIGGSGNDKITGNQAANVLRGEGGDDTLIATYEPNSPVDVMDGGAGIDTADFSRFDKAVWVDLAYNGREAWTRDSGDVTSGTWREVADLNWVENVVGSRANDEIWGDGGDNRLDGGAGGDNVHGRGGDDTLVASYEYNFAVEVLDGGEGSDTADFSSFGKALWIDLNANGREVKTRDTGDLNSGTWREIVDLNGVENLVLGSGADEVWGSE